MVGSDALIYRLVFNLVENGIKYNRPGGAVRVTLQQESRPLYCALQIPARVPRQTAGRASFQAFFRVDKSRSREMGGVGLGLALVREIAVLHGGGVTVESSSETAPPLSLPCRWYSPAEASRAWKSCFRIKASPGRGKPFAQ